MPSTPLDRYLDAALQGKNEAWRFFLALGVIILFWVFLGSVPLVLAIIATALTTPPQESAAALQASMDPLLLFVTSLVSFAFFFVGIWLAVRQVHQRPFTSLINPANRINWSRLWVGFLIWFGLGGVGALVEALLYPHRYVWTFDPAAYFPFAVATLLLVPIQTSAEELFFRGYLLQGFGLRLRHPLVLSLISGIAFMLPHAFNPEVDVNFWLLMAYYFAFGAAAAWFTLKDGGLELALGMHAANNMFAALLANYTDSALQTPALFTVTELDPVFGLVGLLVMLTVAYVLFFRLYPAQEPAALPVSSD